MYVHISALRACLYLSVRCKIYVQLQDKMEHWKPCSVRWFQILTTSLTKYTHESCTDLSIGPAVSKCSTTLTLYNTQNSSALLGGGGGGGGMADLDSQGLKCGHFFPSDSVHGSTFHVCWMLECNSAKATLGRFFVFELGFVFACLAPGLCELPLN